MAPADDAFTCSRSYSTVDLSGNDSNPYWRFWDILYIFTFFLLFAYLRVFFCFPLYNLYCVCTWIIYFSFCPLLCFTLSTILLFLLLLQWKLKLSKEVSFRLYLKCNNRKVILSRVAVLFLRRNHYCIHLRLRSTKACLGTKSGEI